MEELLLSEEELQRREHLRRKERRILEDLAKLAALPQGARFLADMLRSLGLARTLGAEDVPLHNFAMRLLEKLQRADPGRAQAILGMAFNPAQDEEGI